MPRFRPRASSREGTGPRVGRATRDHVRQLAADVLRPDRFFLGRGASLELEHTAREELPWEIFRGRLLDARHTTRRQAFESWNLFLSDASGRPPEPLLSLRLDDAAGRLHVTRAIYTHVWEGYTEPGSNVVLSRETCKWVRELVGTIDLDRFPDLEALRDEVVSRLFRAVVGASRLPLTSTEAPLPAFSLGTLAYFYRPGVSGADAGPARSYRDLADRLADGLSWVEKAKLLETLLHAAPLEELGPAADLFLARWEGGPAGRDVTALLRTLFNEASLSPYTDLVDKALAFLKILEEKGHLSPAGRADFLGHLLRQLGRHLTAYDLVTFHHRGANYPDALLLDAALQDYLGLIDGHPELFTEAPEDPEPERLRRRLRRRALRQGWLLRRRYEGHPVPDAPTSEGENHRVLPPPHVRVPEEQILYPHRRRKALYEGDPLDKHLTARGEAVLRQSIADLRHPQELRELGTALFLDRPLGAGKDPLEPDQTPLFSYEAFSRSIAGQRLQFLAEHLRLIPGRAEYDALKKALETGLEAQGIPVDALDSPGRPGGASLGDARKAAEDFLLLRNTRQPLVEFLGGYVLEPLAERFGLDLLGKDLPRLLVRTGEVFTVYDRDLRRRLEFDVDFRQGYVSRGGIELPASPLRVLRLWEGAGGTGILREHDLRTAPLLVPPRDDE